MRRLIIAALVTLIAIPAFAAGEPTTDEQKTLYAIGLAVARELAVFNLNPAEYEFVQKGINDAVSGSKPLVTLDDYKQKIQELATARRKVQGEKLAAAGKEYIEKAAKEKGAVKTASGLVYQSLKDGTGATPGAADVVKVQYRGTFIDGTEFDSSYKRGQPAEFALNSVIKCWTEGVQMMKVGGKARLVCPPQIAYGENGAGAAIPPNATLVFEIELLDVKK